MKEGFLFSKRFGQNFITDSNLLDAIVRDAQVTKEDTVLEIGAGAGALTRALAAQAGRVVSFEIDRRLEEILGDALKDYSNIELHFCDAMKVDDRELFGLVGQKYKVVANLPYYITTPLIFKFLESPAPPESMTVMVQKEVAERLAAKEGTPDYGVLTVMAGSMCEIELTRKVNRRMFVPVPNVDSAIVRLTLKGGQISADRRIFSRLVKSAFHMRRKTLVNNIMGDFLLSREQAEQMLKAAGIDINARGETLSIERFNSLANIIASK